MSDIDTLKHQIIELKRNQELMLKLLTPKQWDIAKIAEITGRSRQAVIDWVTKNAEPEVGFWKKGGKIIVSEEVALMYIDKRR